MKNTVSYWLKQLPWQRDKYWNILEIIRTLNRFHDFICIKWNKYALILTKFMPPQPTNQKRFSVKIEKIKNKWVDHRATMWRCATKIAAQFLDSLRWNLHQSMVPEPGYTLVLTSGRLRRSVGPQNCKILGRPSAIFVLDAATFGHFCGWTVGLIELDLKDFK